ncbi:protease [Lithospermum erythrorhizon]|uniref:Protease n=1 Tax=Lithospermum erythrorhizon TaxID=34254 RepID=A0AAV3Q062_LITER
MDLNDLNKVWEVKALRKVREDEAKEILEKVAKQVQPIMRKRKWKVKVLSEFCPTNPSLLGLNINGGQEVKIRLRKQNNEFDFLPYNHILHTMLHELCHNEIGPHNAAFYNLLDEIKKECEDLMAKGITGAGKGFDLPGRRVGGYFRQPSLSSLRQSALTAAESRANRGALMPSGPMRLGGNSSIKAALSPIQAAAMAAERRLHDDVWCGSESLLNDGSLGSSTDSVVREVGSSTSPGPIPSQKNIDIQDMWACGACTLLNQPTALACEACNTSKSKAIGSMKLGLWACKFCSLENSKKVERCLACGEWRYSYGAPSSIITPHLGT